jgi:hypothetical protein
VEIPNPTLDLLDVGDTVRVTGKTWSGVNLPDFKGEFVGTGEDSKGIYYRITVNSKDVTFKGNDVKHLETRLARPENVTLIYKATRRIHV